MLIEIDLLVYADYLYPMSAGLPVVSDAEVAIRADRIVYAGPRQATGTGQARQTLSGQGKAVLPGFVNAHSHVASLIFRSQTDDGWTLSSAGIKGLMPRDGFMAVLPPMPAILAAGNCTKRPGPRPIVWVV